MVFVAGVTGTRVYSRSLVASAFGLGADLGYPLSHGYAHCPRP